VNFVKIIQISYWSHTTNDELRSQVFVIHLNDILRVVVHLTFMKAVLSHYDLLSFVDGVYAAILQMDFSIRVT